ncbi:hypothetical protein BTUL_0135g00320 [Botrytis tulipae]|uniref:Uncharacterized protein n=1 Tax=Botrytis tulipae TaxID=87230 RepID=A0A4Z1EN74_9HELO|nr:hypothetical protein BTUL_0135g00320 [Botrytis tulipae]
MSCHKGKQACRNSNSKDMEEGGDTKDAGEGEKEVAPFNDGASSKFNTKQQQQQQHHGKTRTEKQSRVGTDI